MNTEHTKRLMLCLLLAFMAFAGCSQLGSQSLGMKNGQDSDSSEDVFGRFGQLSLDDSSEDDLGFEILFAEKKILFLGEGNFSFVKSFVERYPGLANKVIATELRSEDEVGNINGAEDNIQYLRSKGATVICNIDATKLKIHFPNQKFSHIFFNNPYNHNTNRVVIVNGQQVVASAQLIHDVFLSISKVQKVGGFFHLARRDYWNGWTQEYKKSLGQQYNEKREYDSKQCYQEYFGGHPTEKYKNAVNSTIEHYKAVKKIAFPRGYANLGYKPITHLADNKMAEKFNFVEVVFEKVSEEGKYKYESPCSIYSQSPSSYIE